MAHRSVAAMATWVSAAMPTAAVWCHSDSFLGPLAQSPRKGLALDDTTFTYCPSKVPELWPNTLDVVSSLRLYKAWDLEWPEENRLKSWRKLLKILQVNQAKLLVGAQVTCRPEADEHDWQWTKELLEFLGKKHVMGLAIGNEMDLLSFKLSVDDTITSECLHELWQGGRFWQMFSQRVAELDAMGLAGIPVTSVFGAPALDGDPFREVPAEALVTSFLLNATRAYGSRYVFTFNLYSYFDPAYALDQCQQALAQATCFSEGCDIPRLIARTRRKIQQLTGIPNSTFWIGETGWSSPVATTLHTPLAKCKDWSSMDTFRTFYSNFLRWEMAGTGELPPPDHVFYFTVRNSFNYGEPEYFGLAGSCNNQRCKLHAEDYLAPGEVPEMDLSWIKFALVGVAGLALLSLSVVAIYVKLQALFQCRQLAQEFKLTTPWTPAGVQAKPGHLNQPRDHVVCQTGSAQPVIEEKSQSSSTCSMLPTKASSTSGLSPISQSTGPG